MSNELPLLSDIVSGNVAVFDSGTQNCVTRVMWALLKLEDTGLTAMFSSSLPKPFKAEQTAYCCQPPEQAPLRLFLYCGLLLSGEVPSLLRNAA